MDIFPLQIFFTAYGLLLSQEVSDQMDGIVLSFLTYIMLFINLGSQNNPYDRSRGYQQGALL